MQFIKSESEKEGMHAMADRISAALKDGQVLWLICGGSNIPTAAEAMNEIRASVSPAHLKDLVIAQTDERFGPVGHPDSNWKQMADEKFDWEGIRTVSILHGGSMAETIDAYEKAIMPVIDETLASGGAVIAQFGMGADGHIAGILPHTIAVDDARMVSGYEGKPFSRITLTFPALLKISAAYAFVFGASKAQAVHDLQGKDLPPADEPAQILKQLPEVYLYSDQIIMAS